jgi:glycosyltransferase involved in cell wall biosynthesis
MTPATVVICTHNRATVVRTAIERALAEARPLRGEVLVVDNASTDETPTLLAALARDAPGLRVVQEERLGLSAARNRGLSEARGDVVAYLDDDAVPRPGWLAALLAPYGAPEVGCVGGRIVLRFPFPPPAWLTPALHASFSAFDLGPAPKRLRYRHDDYPYGASISFRARRGRRGGSRPRRAADVISSSRRDRSVLPARPDGMGDRYAPDAAVDHLVLPNA